MSEEKEVIKNKDPKEEKAIKPAPVKEKKKKKKKKGKKLTKTERYFKILKWISITWLTIGLALAISFKYKDHPSFPDKISNTLFSDIKTR